MKSLKVRQSRRPKKLTAPGVRHRVTVLESELLELARYNSELELDKEWFYFLYQCGYSISGVSPASRLREIGNVIGEDAVVTVREDVRRKKASEQPTLWRIFTSGTAWEQEFVGRFCWRHLEFDTTKLDAEVKLELDRIAQCGETGHEWQPNEGESAERYRRAAQEGSLRVPR